MIPNKNKKKDLELYIHIPFCKRKCRYCDFVSASADKEAIDQYFRLLQEEIKTYQKVRDSFHDYQVTTIFFGGGTPSFVEAFYLEKTLDLLGKVFSFAPKKEMEITIEANPGTLTKEKIRMYQAAGINRMSLGLQSVHDGELALLGRIHTFSEFLENYNLARECGFANINVDLMAALPGQKLLDYEKSLRTVASLCPEHISAYSLIIEEDTPFYHTYQEHPEWLPDEDTERDMYHITRKILGSFGYEQYEISNYARKGYACLHNLGYWNRVPYLGLGASAASLFGEKRWTNPSKLSEYKARIKEGNTWMLGAPLSLTEQMEEFMFLGLRKTEGILKQTFKEYFLQSPEAVYGSVIRKFVGYGLLEETKERIYLTQAGMDVSNVVMAEFLMD